MREIFLLLKKDLRNTFGIDKLKKTKPIKLVLYSLLVLYVIVSISVSIAVYARTAADFLIKNNLSSYLILLFAIVASFSCFMFSIFGTKARLFDSKDNDLLFSMPIESKKIFASRFLSILITNFLFSLMFLISPTVIYVLEVSVTPLFYLYMLFIILLVTIIPTALACIFGYLVAKLTSISRVKNIFEMIFSLVFLFGIYYFMGNAQKLLLMFTDNVEVINNIMKYGLYPFYLISKMLINNDILSLLIYIAINGLVLLIFFNIFNKNYKKIISKLHEQKSRKNYKMKTLKSSNQTAALIKKEAKRYFSSPIYVLNTSLGIIMLIVMTIATSFYSVDKILETMDISVNNIDIFSLLVIAYTLLIFFNITTSSSISIEGKNFWLMKSLPVKYSKVLSSKVLFNMILVIPISIISAVILKFNLSLTIIQLLMLILLSIVVSAASSQFGLLINLKFPKMDAISDEQIVKRSASSMISVLVPMTLIMSLAPFITSLKIGSNMLAISAILIFIVISAIEYILLRKYGVKQVKNILV